MNIYNVKTLKDNTFFTDKVLLDKTFVLLDISTPVTPLLLKELEEWRFESIMSEGTIGIGENNNNETEKENSASVIEERLENADSIEKNLAQAVDLDKLDDEDHIRFVKKVYSETLTYITYVFTHYATHSELDLGDISTKVKELCIFIKDNRRFVLRVTQESDTPSRSYLVDHAMRSFVIAIVIGIQLHIPLQKLLELGVTAIVHEIGMLRIPPQLYLTTRPLKANEKKQLITHPLLGFQILKNENFPLSIQLGTLEHHERENGSGYPRSLTGEKISLYGKIIAVACVYDAIVSPRTYKAQKSSHQAVVELLRNESHQYDATIIKALLYSLSLFPIGAYVFMANGKVAIVSDVNPSNPKDPIVQIIGETDENGKPKTIQTNDTDAKINRALSNQEVEDILKAMKKN